MSIDKQILQFLNDSDYIPMKQHDIANSLGLIDKNKRNEFRKVLYHLEKKGLIIRLRKNRWSLPNKLKNIKGTLKFLPNGGAILTSVDNKEVFIGENNLGTAFPDDEVNVEIFSDDWVKANKKFIRPEGKVIDITKRNTLTIVGTLKYARYFKYVLPDNPSFRAHIRINKNTAIKHNHKVLIKIDDWNDPYQSITGTIIKDLGEKSSKGVDIQSMIISAGLEEEFSDNVIDEVKNIPTKITQSEIDKRVDLRDVVTFTIDPETARDFDDAISFSKHPDDGWILGVHIADVSTYVKKDSFIDLEAYKRGNSIYLVDRVIMMLPTELTTKICSLTPNNDHLTHTASIHVNDIGEIISYDTYPSIIQSKCRLTYNQVQKHINGDGNHNIPNQITENLELLYPIINLIRSKRIKNGSLELNTPDIEIKLDESGNVVSINKRSEAKDAYKLVEDCMLLANKVVAEKISNAGVSSIYRIHENPDEEQWAKMALELNALGLNYIPNTRDDLNKIFNISAGSTNEYAVLLSILRNLKRAEYSSYLIEHFGLAFKKYTHFTSPIRRYTDLTIHRILKSIELNQKSYLSKNQINEIAMHCTKTEKKADELEKKSTEKKRIDYYVNELKLKNIDYNGYIVGIKKRGLIVELPETLQRGMIAFSTFKNEWLEINESETAVVNQSGKVIFRLGDNVNVLITNIDTVRNLIDFIIYNPNKKNIIKKHKIIPNMRSGKAKIKKRSRRKKR